MKKEKETKKEERKEVGFITVINVIAGIIIAIFGMLILIIAIFSPAPKLFVPSIVFFAFAVFLFLPQKILKFNKWLKLLIAIVGFFVAIIITGGNIPRAQVSFEEHNLNEEFPVSYNHVNFSMIVYNSSKESKLIVNGQEKTTSGVFLLVRGSATNLGTTPSDFAFSSVLLDSQNKSYSVFSYSLGEGAMQPGVKRDFLNAFEIPNSASGLKFVVDDETKVLRSINLGI